MSEQIRRGPAIGIATGQRMSARLIGYLRRCGRNISRFRHTSDASTAVEFALVFPAFIALIIGILEICYFLFAQQTLQTAASEMGRQFMTNQAPSQSSTINKDGQGNYNGTLNANSIVCNIIKPLLSCSSVIVNVQAYQDWQSASTSMPSSYQMNNNQCAANTGWNYDIGNPGQVVVIQLIYPLNIITGPLGFALKNNCNGTMDVMGVTVIRVEPS
ncbi:MAG: pilus assembly protein [Hyphomicrobiales bacterium]|nr:pilus assembly protein [Hyphomicrobiales bacterium]MBV9429218.1 pilus assembly protein [Bradyrhizobiaceae bacterium]